MNPSAMKLLVPLVAWLLYSPLLQAQLAVTVTPPKVTAHKVIVKLTMKNELKEPVESARAVCFVLDPAGKMVGQSAQWVIGGGTNDRPSLAPEKEISYNFVVTAQNLTTTNLTARVEFSRLLLAGGKLADVKGNVTVQIAPAEAPKVVK